jgi:Amt family ammonium transporter
VIGLFYGGGFSQLFAQMIGAVTCVVFIFTSFYIYFKVADKILGNRVSAEEEIEGLDLGEVGVLAYPDFTLRPQLSLGSTAGATTAEPAIVEDVVPAKAQTSVA